MNLPAQVIAWPPTLQGLQPQPLLQQLLLLFEPKTSSKSNKKFVFVFKSTLLALVKMESNKTNSTSFEKFIKTPFYTKKMINN